MFRVNRKLAFTTGAIFGTTIVLYLAAILIPAWQARYHASRLLTCLRDLHPGITTETQAKARLKPFSRLGKTYDDSEQFQWVTYTFWNAGYAARGIYKLFSPLSASLPQHLLLPSTLMDVTLFYKGGMLIEMRVSEMQEEDIPNLPHPNSALTRILSISAREQTNYLPADFNGYWVFSRNTFGTDANGYPTGFICCHQRFTTLDERATPAQLASSLNFQLRCFTSLRRCKDDRQILP